MHNLTKIRLFRFLLYCTYPIAVLFLYPIAALRKKKPGNLFILFDRYIIGGAQRIHLDILQCITDSPKQIYFTRVSANEALKDAFYSIPNTQASDIHIWCDMLLLRLFSVHYLCFYINRHKDVTVFSANSTFFYDMLPFLRKSVRKIELLHMFTHGKKGMEWFGLANIHRLDYRIIYDSYTLSNLRKQYTAFNIDPSYLDRLLFIEPGVYLPAQVDKSYEAPLKVMYAGRGGPQKRIWLLNRIAAHFMQSGRPVEFHFAGTIDDDLSEDVKQRAVMHGEISRPEQMRALYQQCHVILMTSAYEGFPMLIKEGMAYGCVPVVTALEGNKMHLSSERNALLIDAVEDEEAVVEQGIARLNRLLNEPALLEKLSANAMAYARLHFDKRKFEQAYRDLLLN